MAGTKTKSRADQALDQAREAYELASATVIRMQAQGFVIGALIGVLRDMAIIPRDAVGDIFIGAAAIIDASYEDQDDDQRTTLDASRTVVAEMAEQFGISIPPAGQTGVPLRQ